MFTQLEEDQIIKESRIRESSHQFNIPGERITSSTAKGMANRYEQTL